MARWGLTWDKKSLIRDLALYALLIVAMYPTQGAGFAIMWGFAISALTRNNHERLLLVMLLTIGVLVGNETFMPKGVVFVLFQKSLIVFLAVALMMKSMGMGRHSPLVRPFLALMPYMMWMAISSIQGWSPIISYLKLFLFITCFFAFYGIANVVILGERAPIIKVRTVFLSLCCFTLFGSMALIPFPGLAQLHAEYYLEALAKGHEITSLFTGITYHSQALGPLSAMLFVALFSDFILTVRKKDWLYIALMVCAPILVLKTSSRTAMGTMIAGTMFTLWHFLQTRQVESGWKARVMSGCMLLGLLGGIALAFSGSGREAFAKFVTKNQGVQSMSGISSEDLVSTRQSLMDESMYNFHKKPMIGNGFQVSEVMSQSGGGGAASLLTAPVEKGVWVTAILEEGGVPGMVLFVLFGVIAIPMLVKRKAYTGATILFTMFVVNLGEFTFFSMSGIGGYYWALCFMAVVLDAQRLREHKIVTWYATEDEIARDPDLNPYA